MIIIKDVKLMMTKQVHETNINAEGGWHTVKSGISAPTTLKHFNLENAAQHWFQKTE